MESYDPNVSLIVRATVPSLTNNVPEPIITNRLIIRPLKDWDFAAIHLLRSQPEIRAPREPNKRMRETLPSFNSHIGRNFLRTHAVFGILLKNNDGSEGDLIGEGGVYHFTPGPNLVANSKKNTGTKATVQSSGSPFYKSNLPREVTTLEVYLDTLSPQERTRRQAVEKISALIPKDNNHAKHFLLKIGFNPVQEPNDISDILYFLKNV